MTDNDLKVIAGTDAALYVIFLRYSAIFFFMITLFNFLTFMPIYVTGDPKTVQDIQDSNHDTIVIALMTAINITGNSIKQQIIFILMMLVYSVGAFMLMFFYWRKSVHWRYRKHSHQDPFLD